MAEQPRYLIVVDDEAGLRDTYKQYLTPTQGGAAGSALDRLRKLKAASAPAAAATADGGLPPGQRSILPGGWEMLQAESGEKALEAAQQVKDKGGEICLAFFDVKMPPGIDGIETMIRMLKVFPRMRCGIVSAYNDRSVDEINALFDPGHQDRWDFISKPFTEQEIRQKARMLISTWLVDDAEQRARAELASMNANLEKLVSERTSELQRAKDELAVREQRMRAELEMAAQIQNNLLPASWPTHNGLDVVAKIEPSAETAGDICGWFDTGNGQCAIYICDVTGHGAAAALGTAVICATIKAIEHDQARATAPLSPGEVLKRLNRIVRETMRGSLFATFFMGVFDPKAGKMRYSSAGHEWPLVARGATTSIVPLLASPRLGDVADPHYPDLEAAMGSGDVLLLYTDGLTDAKDSVGRPFDRRRLFKALAGAPKESADSVKSAVDKAFRDAVPAGAPPEDDITWVVIRTKGETQGPC